MSGSVGETLGRCKWFNGRKGYGFLTTVGTENPTDVFVHHSNVKVGEEQYKYLVEENMFHSTLLKRVKANTSIRLQMSLVFMVVSLCAKRAMITVIHNHNGKKLDEDAIKDVTVVVVVVVVTATIKNV